MLSRRNLGLGIVVALALAATVVGWREFWFLTDDAFIAFRYVRNSLEGHGYVWNRAPFKPVDGYTSFAWVALLDVTWRLTGIAPPESANVLSLFAALGSVSILARWLWRTTARLDSSTARIALVAVGLLATVSNRTFLAWTSSGLETSLYVFAVTGWFAAACASSRRAEWACAACAALAVLTRPDGLPIWAMTVAWTVLSAFTVQRPLRPLRWPRFDRRKLAPASAAVVPVLAFAIWRSVRYHALLPNTFYAKVTGMNPAAGARFLGSFVLEYAIWAWLLFVGVGLVIGLRTRAVVFGRWVGAVFVLVFHVGYYGLVVGGDHFEYKAFAHLVPVMAAGACAAATHLLAGATGWKRAGTWVSAALVVLLAWPIPWIHYAGTRKLTSREETFALRYAVAPHLPRPVRAYGEWFDAMQGYLIERFFCMRHQEHKVFYEWKNKDISDQGADIVWDADDVPVTVAGEAGLVGWKLQNVAVIDAFGLNDRFIARNPQLRPVERVGHDRQPPPGYVEAFRPNVVAAAGTVKVVARPRPLDENEVKRIEDRFDAWLKTQKGRARR